MVPVALAGHVISNSTHFPSLLLMMCPARATGPVSNNERKWAELLMMRPASATGTISNNAGKWGEVRNNEGT